jgi:predicted nuclease with TOPRIM domain
MMEESVNLVYEKVKDLEKKISELSDDIRLMKDNHLHHLDLRLTTLETSLSIGWKAVIFGAGIPAILSAILSLVQFLK